MKYLINERLRKGERVVMRVGHYGEYEYYNSVYEAGYDLGGLLAGMYVEDDTDDEKVRRLLERLLKKFKYDFDVSLVIDGIFDGLNNIALYIGDEDDNIVRGLNKNEYNEFLRGVREGFLWY